jgi:hypothetical protein
MMRFDVHLTRISSEAFQVKDQQFTLDIVGHKKMVIDYRRLWSLEDINHLPRPMGSTGEFAIWETDTYPKEHRVGLSSAGPARKVPNFDRINRGSRHLVDGWRNGCPFQRTSGRVEKRWPSQKRYHLLIRSMGELTWGRTDCVQHLPCATINDVTAQQSNLYSYR